MSGPIPVPPASPPGPISVRPGPSGPPGPPGPPGLGVPAGGTTGQVLTKDSAADYDTSWQDPTGGGGATNLSITNRGATTLDIASSTGTDATVPAATTSLAGLMAGADKSKLDGIEAGATALALGNTNGAAPGTAAPGTATTAARSDHVHPPSPPATTSTAGLMSGADKTKLDGIEAGAQVNVGTNLSYTAGTRLLESSTGTDVTLPLFTSANAGLVPASGGGTSNFLRADGTFAAPAGGGVAFPPIVSTRWFGLANGYSHLAAGSTSGTNTIYYTFWRNDRQVTISDLACRVTTAVASSNVALAIYAHDNTTGRPTGFPLAATGSISSAATGNVSADITGPNVTLEPGNYWVAWWPSAAGIAVTVQTMNNGAMNQSNLVGSATLANVMVGNNAAGLIITSAETYNPAAWPDAALETFAEIGFQNYNIYALARGA